MSPRRSLRGSRPLRDSAARGFTLVELMVVIVILGSLIAIVGPRVFHAIAESDNSIAEQQMHNFAQSLDMYYIKHRKMPNTLDALTEEDPQTGEPLIEKIPNDPWGNPYQYHLEGAKKYKIVSMGEDGQEGTQDDITWPKIDE